MSIAEQQDALVKTTKGTAEVPYSAVEAPIAKFFGMTVEQRRNDTPAFKYDTIHVEEPPPAGNQSFVSSLRKKVTGLFSKANGSPPVQMGEKPNLNFYQNNARVNNSNKPRMTVNNVRANMARRLATATAATAATAAAAPTAATRRSRRLRKSKPNTRRRR